MAVEQQQEVVVANRLAAPVAFVHRFAPEIDAEAAREIMRPFVVAHFIAVGLEPVDVLGFRAANRAALEEVAPAEYRMLAAQGDQALHEGEEFAVGRPKGPSSPSSISLSWQ